MTTEQVRQMTAGELVGLVNDCCADESQRYPFIRENTEEFLDEVADDLGGYWVAKAIENGTFHASDKFIFVSAECSQIDTFTTREELFERVIDPEEIARRHNEKYNEDEIPWWDKE